MPKLSAPCFKCEGSGVIREFSHVDDGTCYACKGTGKVTEKKRTEQSASVETHGLRSGVSVRFTDARLDRMNQTVAPAWRGRVGTVTKSSGSGRVTVAWPEYRASGRIYAATSDVVHPAELVSL